MAEINLRTVQALSDYTNAELKLLAAVAPARLYADGQDLCQEGDPGVSCFLVAQGEVVVCKQVDDEERVLATLRAGSIVGQMALVDKSARSATLRAQTQTIALELSREVFERLLEAHSKLALRFQHQIAVAGIRQLRVATRKLSEVLADGEEATNEREQSFKDTQRRGALLTVQAALTEWNMDLQDLDLVTVSVPDGQLPTKVQK